MTSTTIEPEIIRRLRTSDMVAVSRQYMRNDVAERICRTHLLYCDYHQSSGVFEFRKWGIGAPWLPDPEAFRVQIVWAGQGERHP